MTGITVGPSPSASAADAGNGALAWVAQHVVLVSLGHPVRRAGRVRAADLADVGPPGPHRLPDSGNLGVGQLPRRVHEVPLALWFANSTLYAGLATMFMLASSVPAAYVLAKNPFPRLNALFLAIIVAMLLPPQVTAVPLYVMWTQLGLTGSLWPLILPNLLGDAFSTSCYASSS